MRMRQKINKKNLAAIGLMTGLVVAFSFIFFTSLQNINTSADETLDLTSSEHVKDSFMAPPTSQAGDAAVDASSAEPGAAFGGAGSEEPADSAPLIMFSAQTGDASTATAGGQTEEAASGGGANESTGGESQGQKLVAITFDDGPHETLTPQLLEILKREGIKATFFVTGINARKNPDVLRQILADGHQIGSHTYNHKDLTELSEEELQRELNDTISAIEEATGQRPTAMRPPYGAYNEEIQNIVGMPLILWSLDPMDWKYKNADTVYKSIVSYAKDGDIILMHDIHPTSVQAAEKIIVQLKQEGYTFLTVDQLIHTRRGQAVSGKAYGALRP